MRSRTGSLLLACLLSLGATMVAIPQRAFASTPWPIAAPWEAGVTNDVGGAGSFYGEDYHDGQDFYAVDINGLEPGDADCGQEIRATAAGTVTVVGDFGDGYGIQVVIDHGEGYTSRYAHLERALVEQNASVGRGAAIGQMGSTGQSDFCHLHFVIYKDGQSIPPSPMSGTDLYAGVDVISDNDPASTPTDSVPSGELTSPSPGSKVTPGQRIAVGGTFRDDRGITRVDFFVADDSYQWKMIGSDSHSGNGDYLVHWNIEYPVGANLHFHAHAFDSAGHEAIESVRGVDDVVVVPHLKRHHRQVTLERADDRNVGTGRVTAGDGFDPCYQEVPLRLQRRSEKGWRTVSKARTTSDGLFVFELPSTGRVRVVVPRVRLGDHSHHVCLAAASKTLAPSDG